MFDQEGKYFLMETLAMLKRARRDTTTFIEPATRDIIMLNKWLKRNESSTEIVVLDMDETNHHRPGKRILIDLTDDAPVAKRVCATPVIDNKTSSVEWRSILSIPRPTISNDNASSNMVPTRHLAGKAMYDHGLASPIPLPATATMITSALRADHDWKSRAGSSPSLPVPSNAIYTKKPSLAHKIACNDSFPTGTIFAIGHSSREISLFIAMLKAARITRLVDIRSKPSSTANPHFGQSAFSILLEEAGIGYVWAPGLGGFRKGEDTTDSPWTNQSFASYSVYMLNSPVFAQSLEWLIQSSAKERSAICCAEGTYSKCHRRIVSDALISRNVPVYHLEGRYARSHVVTPGCEIVCLDEDQIVGGRPPRQLALLNKDMDIVSAVPKTPVLRGNLVYSNLVYRLRSTVGTQCDC